VSWERLQAARLQAHWAAQLLGAAADATIAAQDDDSHTSFIWDRERGALVGRAGVALNIAELALAVERRGRSQRTPLGGMTLTSAREWLAAALALPDFAFRNYEMPDHPVRSGARFDSGDAAAFAELSIWFANGDLVLEKLAADSRSSPLLTWPHHFDSGGILAVKADSTVGYGLSPGDKFIPEPYFYVTPSSADSATTVSPLPLGTWQREEFFGAVLGAPELTAIRDAEKQRAAAEKFLAAGISASIEIVSRV
jgi:hypothetical protein